MKRTIKIIALLTTGCILGFILADVGDVGTSKRVAVKLFNYIEWEKVLNDHPKVASEIDGIVNETLETTGDFQNGKAKALKVRLSWLLRVLQSGEDPHE